MERHPLPHFADSAPISFASSVLVHQFLQRIGLRSQFAWSVWFRQRTNRYQTSDTVLAVLYPVILGMERCLILRVHLLFGADLQQQAVGRCLALLGKAESPTQKTPCPKGEGITLGGTNLLAKP